MKFDNFYKILTYEEVAFFGKAQKNRKINEQHVNEFVTILKDKTFVPDEDGDMLAYGIIPIIVNPVTNHILDGQHKLEAYKHAIDRGLIPNDVKILIGYWRVNDEAHENEVTIMLNSKSKNWALNDYLNAYAQDNDYYSKLKTFCQSHSLAKRIRTNGNEELKYRYGAAIITGKHTQAALRDGTLTFTDEEYKNADAIHKELVSIMKKLNLTSTNVEEMAIEWHLQRKIVPVADILSMQYIPKDVREGETRTRNDWKRIFARLKDEIERKRLEAA